MFQLTFHRTCHQTRKSSFGLCLHNRACIISILYQTTIPNPYAAIWRCTSYIIWCVLWCLICGPHTKSPYSVHVCILDWENKLWTPCIPCPDNAIFSSCKQYVILAKNVENITKSSEREDQHKTQQEHDKLSTQIKEDNTNKMKDLLEIRCMWLRKLQKTLKPTFRCWAKEALTS